MDSKTNKVILVIGVIVVIILVVIGIVFTFHRSGAPGEVENSGTNYQVLHGTIKDLLSLGQSSKCTIVATRESEVSQGSMYVGDGKFRGDFTMSYTDATQTVSHIASDGQDLYAWSDSSDRGFKLPLSEAAAITSATSTSQTPSEFKAVYDYTCEPWAVDDSVFALPTAIRFSDVSKLIGSSTMTGTGSSGGLQCSTCDRVPAQYQAQCRARLCK